jgi:hypothetical protein
VQLTQDQYGNYVIQHVLEHGTNAERTAIISQLAPHIVALSQNKFASNVVEKCLLHGSPQQRVALVEGILNSPGPRAHPQPSSSSGSVSGEEGEGGFDAAAAAAAAEDAEADPLYKMMKDQFGNYVVQKVLEVRPEPGRWQAAGQGWLQVHHVLYVCQSLGPSSAVSVDPQTPPLCSQWATVLTFHKLCPQSRLNYDSLCMPGPQPDTSMPCAVPPPPPLSPGVQ